MVTQRIVLTGNTLAWYPEGGGHFSVRLQYLLALRELGEDFIWLELMGASDDKQTNQRVIRGLLERFSQYGLEGHCVVAILPSGTQALDPNDVELVNSDATTLAGFIRPSDILWNFHCSMREPLLSAFQTRVLLDLDPGHLQVSALQVDMDIDQHDVLCTVGLNINGEDCDVPTLGRSWTPFPPPVHLPFWSDGQLPAAEAPFTSVTQWNGWDFLRYKGKELSIGKREAYLQYLDLPSRTQVPLELAANIHPADQTGDRENLLRHGWRLVDAHQHTSTPESYRSYISRSRGEFGCAKPIFVQLRTGWLSDRTAAYLAAGRPAVIEDTGIAGHIPTDLGLLTFSDGEEAIAQLERCQADYEAHRVAAQEIAREHLDAQRILPRLIELSTAS